MQTTPINLIHLVSKCDPKKANEIINECIYKTAERLIVFWANQYKENPKGVIESFLKYESIKMSVTLITFWAREKGVLKEIDKDFSGYVNRLNLEEKWKPVLNKFLIILWGVTK